MWHPSTLAGFGISSILGICTRASVFPVRNELSTRLDYSCNDLLFSDISLITVASSIGHSHSHYHSYTIRGNMTMTNISITSGWRRGGCGGGSSSSRSSSK